MDKAIYTREQLALSRLLRQLRIDAGLRQADVAAVLHMPQSFVSKYESGERRLDLVELRQVCRVLGVSTGRLVSLLDDDPTRDITDYDERAALRSDEPAGPARDSAGPPPDESQ